MKILYVTSRVPWPLNRGDRLRAYHQLRYLSKKHEVTLFCMAESGSQVTEALPALRKVCDEVIAHALPRSLSLAKTALFPFSRKPLQVLYYYSRRIKKHLEALIRKNSYDLIMAQLIRTAEYLRKVSDVPKILDLVDSYSLHYLRAGGYKKGPRRLLNSIELKRVATYEGTVVRDFDAATVCSPVDAAHINAMLGEERVGVVAYGVDSDHYAVVNTGRSAGTVLFAGNMSYGPNLDAALFLAREVMPRVWDERRDIRLTIAGMGPPAALRRLSRNRLVQVTGYVEDMRLYYWRSAILAAPIRYGAGVQTKILEAMSCGCPVLTTPLGMEGIGATGGRHCVVSEPDADSFAQSVLGLIEDKPTADKMAREARLLIERDHAWDKALGGLETLIESLRRDGPAGLPRNQVTSRAGMRGGEK